MIRAVFFDVANTLLDKPDLFPSMQSALQKHGYEFSTNHLAMAHKSLSEAFVFPDKTSREFYQSFNQHLLYALGIIPNDKLVDDIFSACTYLPWRPFDDTYALEQINLPLGVLSNWDSSLKQKLAEHFTAKFDWILCSQDEGVKKPDMRFFQRMLDATGYKAEEILFVGDSLKLDVHPATQLGVHAVLIDRQNQFSAGNTNRITELIQLTKWL